MRNPFIYGEEAADEAFCDREGEIKELLRDIQNGVNVIIFSPRRYGKTSLIKQVLKQLDKKKTASVYVDLYPAVSKISSRQIQNFNPECESHYRDYRMPPLTRTSRNQTSLCKKQKH
jgi:hypothetical protein